MFNFSFAELLTLGVVALIVLGPEKLPQAMRKLGTYYAKIRRTISTIQTELESELNLAETRQKMQEELAKIKKAEAEMQSEMAMMRSNMRKFEKQQDAELTQTATPEILENNTLVGANTNNNELVTSNQDNNIANKNKENNDGELNNKTDSNKSIDAIVSVNNPNVDKIELDSADSVQIAPTRPWENMWFKLGEYDKARRQPKPPFLPDNTPDPLLNNSRNLSEDATILQNNTNLIMREIDCSRGSREL